MRVSSRDVLDDIHFRPEAASLKGDDLGPYYLDLTAAIPLIQDRYHGPLDAKGVPLTQTHGAAPVYNAVTIAQYALALHARCLQRLADTTTLGQFKAQADALLGLVETRGRYAGFVVHTWDNPKYPAIRAPWVSALTQGNAISALLRAHALLEEPAYLLTARKMFLAMGMSVSDGGVRLLDRCGHLWFEEYPVEPPLHVLNGFVFALWGVLDYAKALNDLQAWQWWDQGVSTLRAHLPAFDCGFWSVYDLRYRELVSLHYHRNIHVPQLAVLHTLTGESLFASMRDRWSRFATSKLRRALWWCAVRAQARWRGSEFR